MVVGETGDAGDDAFTHKRMIAAVAEDCQDFILNNLDLSRVFDCGYYPDSPHGDECLDLSAGGKLSSI